MTEKLAVQVFRNEVVRYHLPVLKLVDKNMYNISVFSRILFFVGATLLMFFYIYQCNFAFIGIPHQLHSSRLACVFFIIWAGLKGKNKNDIYDRCVVRNIKKNIIFFIILLVYSFLLVSLYGMGDGLNISTQLINIFLFGFTALWAWNRIFDSFDDIMRTLLYVGIMQSFFICLCLASPSFSSMLDITLNATEERDFFEMQIRRDNYAGGVGCIAAPGLIRYSVSMVAAVYVYCKKKHLLSLATYIYLGIVGMMIARTGLIMFAISMVFLLFMASKNKRIISTSLILLLFGILIVNIVDTGKYDSFISERFKRYIFLSEDRGEEFFTDYFSGENTVIPPLNSDTFWGGGLISGTSGNGYTVHVDGGFLRLYAAIGVLGVFLFYFFNVKYMFKASSNIKERNVQLTCLLFLLILLIGETKENVLIMGWSVSLYYACVLCAYKSHRNNEQKRLYLNRKWKL